MKPKSSFILVAAILLLVAFSVAVNYSKQLAVDQSKMPEKVELHESFQKWLTNHKNKGLNITADEFRLKEKNEVFNSTSMKVYSSDNSKALKRYEEEIDKHKSLDEDVVFSPSGRQFLDYRHVFRDDFDLLAETAGEETQALFAANVAQYLGLQDDKIIHSKILICNLDANCYFDRAFFLDNDVFVISEISRNIEKDDLNVTPCAANKLCTYTFKLHVIDLKHNSRLVYESNPFELILKDQVEHF